MFTIIAGVLGVIIAIALLIIAYNYLGNSLNDSTEKARYAAFQNTGNQIKNAVQFYATTTATFPQGDGEQILKILEGENIGNQNKDNLQYLKPVPRYLTSAPDLPPAGTKENWKIVGKYAFTPLADIAQCKKMNGYANLAVDGPSAPTGGCPICTETQWDAYPACQNAP